MKKIALAVSIIVGMSNLALAGGGMKEVTPVVEPVVAVPMVKEHNGFYAGLGLTAVSTRDARFDVDWGGNSRYQDRLGNITFIGGYNYNAYIALEGRYTTSVLHEDLVEMSGWSLFVKPQYPVSEAFSIYALLGYSGINLDGINGALVNMDDTGFQWGLGADYMIMEDVSLFADYRFANDVDAVFFNGADQVTLDAFTIGANYHF